MNSIPGYSDLNIIYHSQTTLVYSGVRQVDGESVILRQLRPEFVSPERVAQYTAEFELLRELDSPYIITPLDLLDLSGSPILVTQDISGTSLADLIGEENINLVEAITIARCISLALIEIHNKHIVHKDINPANIIYNKNTGALKLIDFGIALNSTPDSLNTEANNTLEGTLAYLAPEQTGRMNRQIDYRTDFYSLGATLYHLTTGVAPFESRDPLALVYSHITRLPTPPEERNLLVPKALSKIILKLLSKMPEDRYQSAYAINQDLERCLEMVKENRLPAVALDFEVALDDIAEQLNLSEQLRERQEVLDIIGEALASASDGGTETIICVGESGVGKSSIIRELEGVVAATGGYVVTGQHSPIPSGVPYSAITQALNDLVRLLLTQPDFPEIRINIREALQGYETAMLGLIPELARILEPVNVESSAADTKNRLVTGISKLIQVITTKGKPFVFCLDNIHWTDQASIDLYEPLFTQLQIPHVFLLGAYSSKELAASDETRIAMTELARNNPSLKLLRLDNLGVESVKALLSESIFRAPEEVQELAALVHLKTSGNPLAVKEFLHGLVHKNLLVFDRQYREWTWDIEKIKSEPPSENVGEILAEHIQHLDSGTAELLQIAACIGTTFDLETLRGAAQLSYPKTLARLAQATQEGYILNQPHSVPSSYRFAHERVQRAAYSLLSEKRRQQIHNNIGQTFLQSDGKQSNIFDLVNQLNNSFDSLENASISRNKLARLNLDAGRKAKQAAAFQSAFKYFKTAIALYGHDIWNDYDLSLELHLEAAETAYLCGDQTQLDLLLGTLLTNAQSALDKSRVQEIAIRNLIASDQLIEATRLGTSVLTTLGVRLPGRVQLGGVFLFLKLIPQTISMSRHVALKPTLMLDKEKLAAMRILMALCQAGYLSGDKKVPLYILKMTELSIKHGMAPESSFAYSMFGALLIASLGTIDLGYRFGKLALDNLNQSNHDLHCKSLVLSTNFIMIWKNELKSSLEPLAQAYKVGMESGDVEFALIAAITSSANAFIMGHDLNSLEATLAIHNKRARELKQAPILHIGSIYQQTINNLTEKNARPWILDGAAYSEYNHTPTHQHFDKSSLANLYITKLFTAVLFGQSEQALTYARKARRLIQSVISSPAVPFFIIYESLAYVSMLDNVSYREQVALRLRLRANRRLLRKWSHHAPGNVLHGYHLIEAERAKFYGQQDAAAHHYDKAIEFARKFKYLKELGLANELTGRFHLAMGKRDLAMYYLDRANTSYRRWGAITKVQKLNDEFSELAESEQLRQVNRNLTAPELQRLTNDNLLSYGNLLDLGSVIKASQVLSGEIVLESLLERLMQVCLENAGAHSASLILAHDNQFVVEITTWNTGPGIEHRLKKTPLESTEYLPISVIQYVARTQEDLVLNDALTEDIFTQDDYILSQKPKSILCIPIQSKSHLTGILYLENRQATHGFTQNRVAILKLLASQSAIAIENAKLYQQLNDSRNRYLSLYRNAIEGIYEIDTNGILTNINPAASQLLGYDSPEEILDTERNAMSDVFVNSSDFTKIQSELGSKGRVVGFETQLLKKDLTVIWVSLSAQLVFDEEKGETHLEGSVIDISERRLREEAEQAMIIAEAATETKSQFLANMSHEIRTPMNAIIGYTDLTLGTKLTAEQQTYLETIRSSSNHLLRVVNDILDISKVESGKLELQKSFFQLQDIFSDLQNLFELAAKAKGIQLILPTQYNDSRDTFIGDPVRICQILINLVGNALKFTEEGEVEVSLDVLKFDDGNVCFNFIVTDTGIGIEDSQLESIFESFTQGSITPTDSGTGLGLSISRNLVEMMDGHIHATSKMSEGSRFYFSIIVEEWHQQSDVSENDPPPPSLPLKVRDRHILLVEDNLISQDLAREVISKAGYRVTVADNGEQALQILEDEDFFAILMDIRMPVMDGMQTIRIIRETECLKHVVVIALSAGVLDTEVQLALDAGFDHYLSKPVDFAALLKLLEELTNEPIASPDGRTEPSPDIQLNTHGIDFDKALRNHGQDLSLLFRLTTTFVEIYQHADLDLNKLLDNDDAEKAERLMHNLAGVSGSFGADALMHIAREIEHSLQKDGNIADAQLTRFKQELANFVAAIDQLHQADVT